MGTHEAWDWNHELVLQEGKFGDGDIRAWGLATDTGYTWRKRRWQPRFGLSVNTAGGDRDPNNPDLQTLNPLYPRGNYFSELALLGPRNFYDLHSSLTVSPTKQLSVSIAVDMFWRQRSGDGVYSPGGGLLRSGEQSNEHFVGTELALSASYQFNTRLGITATYAHYFPGAFIEETGPSHDIDFLEITLRGTF